MAIKEPTGSTSRRYPDPSRAASPNQDEKPTTSHRVAPSTPQSLRSTPPACGPTPPTCSPNSPGVVSCIVEARRLRRRDGSWGVDAGVTRRPDGALVLAPTAGSAGRPRPSSVRPDGGELPVAGPRAATSSN